MTQAFNNLIYIKDQPASAPEKVDPNAPKEVKVDHSTTPGRNEINKSLEALVLRTNEITSIAARAKDGTLQEGSDLKILKLESGSILVAYRSSVDHEYYVLDAATHNTFRFSIYFPKPGTIELSFNEKEQSPQLTFIREARGNAPGEIISLWAKINLATGKRELRKLEDANRP